MESLLSDLKFGVRLLARSPLFAGLTLLMVAVGVGGTTAVFSVINGVLLRRLPYADADRLFWVYQNNTDQGWTKVPADAPDFLDWRAQNHVFEDIAATVGANYNLTGDGQPESLAGPRVSPGLFEMLRVQPVIGRSFTSDEERLGRDHVVVISERLWYSGRGSSGGVGRTSLRSTLVIGEVSLCLVLVIGAALLIRSFEHLRKVNAGFHPERLLVVDVGLPAAKYADQQRKAAFVQDLLARVRSLPGAESAAAGLGLPLSGVESGIAVNEVEAAPRGPGAPGAAGYRQVSPNYFATMGTALVRGRDFDDRDRDDSPPVVIVNETFARQFLSTGDPIGKRIQVGDGFRNPCQVVGVVRDVRHKSLAQDAGPEMYFPFAQRCWGYVQFVVRTRSQPEQLANAIRAQVQAVDPDQPIEHVRTMSQLVSESLAQRRFAMTVLAVFAGVALLLALAGIYGVLAYSVTQRIHEFGIRMAIGARGRDVLALVLGQGIRLTLCGLGIGLVLSFALTRVLSGQLFGVSPTDAVTFTGVPAVLALAALLACYVPARRATRVHPMVALRYE